MPNNTKGRFRSFQGPLLVQRWSSMFQGKDVRGSFFKVVRKKTTGAGSTASLWAMNDSSPSPSGIDSRLRQTTSECRWKHACLGDCSACVWKLPQHPGPRTPPPRALTAKAHPPPCGSSSAGLTCTHLEVPPLGYLHCSLTTCFPCPEIYFKHTHRRVWHYASFK